MTLFFADLDKLKVINDTYGHGAGDEALKKTAQVLREIFRESDIIARIGGDEFAVITVDGRRCDPDEYGRRLKQRLRKHNAERKEPYDLSLSMGAAVSGPDELASIEKLMSQADEILYKNKPRAPLAHGSSGSSGKVS
jgi:diguanylate cyclase (GGDEF)-like protein